MEGSESTRQLIHSLLYVTYSIGVASYGKPVRCHPLHDWLRILLLQLAVQVVVFQTRSKLIVGIGLDKRCGAAESLLYSATASDRTGLCLLVVCSLFNDTLAIVESRGLQFGLRPILRKWERKRVHWLRHISAWVGVKEVIKPGPCRVTCSGVRDGQSKRPRRSTLARMSRLVEASTNR